MRHNRDQENGRGIGKGWTRRLFATSVLSGIGFALARMGKGDKAAAPVSMKEASHYVCLDREEGSER